jgi:signal transduction histidine kinase
LNKAKDRVFAIVSHDLRSPLTSVQGVLELVKDEIIKGDELNNLVDGVEYSLRKNVEVIEELLAWAKKQLSGFDLEMQQVELKPILDDIVTSHSFIALQKKVKLESEVNQQSVQSDANAIRIIFRNLISNAIKYTDPGGIVKVQVTDLQDKVRITVADNGIGIPETDQDKIFRSISWTRVGTGNEIGSGFGLSLSKEFVEKMNGKIWYESEEGKGTTFFVELPK